MRVFLASSTIVNILFIIYILFSPKTTKNRFLLETIGSLPSQVEEISYREEKQTEQLTFESSLEIFSDWLRCLQVFRDDKRMLLSREQTLLGISQAPVDSEGRKFLLKRLVTFEGHKKFLYIHCTVFGDDKVRVTVIMQND